MEVSEGMVLGSLAGFSLYDLRYKEVPAVGLSVFGLAVLIYRLCMGEAWYSLLTGVVPGVVLLLVSLCTKESIGYGDGLMLLVLGVFCGLQKTVAILGMALVLIALAAIVLLVLHKAGRKTELPFLPFVFAGYLLVLHY